MLSLTTNQQDVPAHSGLDSVLYQFTFRFHSFLPVIMGKRLLCLSLPPAEADITSPPGTGGVRCVKGSAVTAHFLSESSMTVTYVPGGGRS